MQSNPQTDRFSGLIAVLGLVAVLVGLVVMLLLPDIRLAAWGILGLGVILLATAFIIEFRTVGRVLTGRRGRFSAGTTVMASVFIGIILFVNAISVGNFQRFDLTGLAQFTLTPQTQEALSKLETPVKALTFFTPNDPYGIGNYATNLLNEYQNYTDQLEIESIDPDEHPDQARQYGILQYQTVVFESENRRQLVLAQEIAERAEHAFTSAILEVTGTVQKKVYFITGHDESNINSTASDGYMEALQGLFDNLYQVGVLDLLVTPSVPEDATALIIAAPRRSLISNEVEIIQHYLENGGWALFLLNPNPPPEIKQLLSPWGIKIEDGIAIDTAAYAAPSIDSPLVDRTRNFFDLSQIYFPGAAAISPQEEVTDTLQMLPLLFTSADSWLERDFIPSSEPQFDEDRDLMGPMALGILVAAVPTEGTGEETPQETRLVVIGDSDFASNQHFYNGNNGELFIETIKLLTAGTELVSIERKVVPFRRLVVGPETTNFIRISSIGLLPAGVLVIGGIIWWRRRQ